MGNFTPFSPLCKRGVRGDFINQSSFHNVIPATFLSGNPQLDSCQIHAGMTYLRTFSLSCYHAKFLYLIQNLFSFDTSQLMRGYLLKITHTFTRRAQKICVDKIQKQSRCPMIQKFVENIEKIIASNPIILSSNIQKQFGSEDETVYLKGNLLLIDSSVLEIAIFATKFQDETSIRELY
ncbi:MAG: hypothetical protein AABY79_12660 [Nitrospirota bacterium]